MSKQQPEPCPFCGKEALIEIENLDSRANGDARVNIYCSAQHTSENILKCNVCEVSPVFSFHGRRGWDDIAIQAWNSRPIQDKLKAENAKLREALQTAYEELSPPDHYGSPEFQKYDKYKRREKEYDRVVNVITAALEETKESE